MYNLFFFLSIWFRWWRQWLESLAFLSSECKEKFFQIENTPEEELCPGFDISERKRNILDYTLNYS